MIEKTEDTGLRRAVERLTPRRPSTPNVAPDLLGDPEDWQEAALCRQTDPEQFFPEKGGSTREAKRICSRCPVQRDCLEAALRRDERFGIWGGLSDRERRKLKRSLGAGKVVPMRPRKKKAGSAPLPLAA